MNRHFPGIALVTTLAFGSGCGSETQSCVSRDEFLCGQDLAGFPFVTDALMASDQCGGLACAGLTPPDGTTSVTMSYPEPGKLCLSGRVSSSGFGVLALEFALKNRDGTKIVAPFDAAARGITQVTLAIDSPPSQGLALQAHMITHRECPVGPLDCFYPPNFKYMDITAAGPVSAPLADFKSDDDPTVTIDPTVLNDVFLQVSSGSVDFCIHDFNFLDAAGNAVRP
jgi:hypothetical protein